MTCTQWHKFLIAKCLDTVPAQRLEVEPGRGGVLEEMKKLKQSLEKAPEDSAIGGAGLVPLVSTIQNSCRAAGTMNNLDSEKSWGWSWS